MVHKPAVAAHLSNRRGFLTGMGTVAVGGLAGCAGGNGENGDGSGKVTISHLSWDASDFENPNYSPDYDVLFIYWLEQELEEIDTEVDIEITRAGEIGGPAEAFRAVQNRTVDIGMDTASYNADVLPLSNAHVLPELYISSHVGTMAAWEINQPGGLVDELEVNDFGLRNLTVLALPPYQVYSLEEVGRIESLEDFQGLSIRATGTIGRAFENLGASPVEMPITEVYMALERGTIDAAITNLNTGVNAYNFHEVADFVTTNLSPGSVPSNIWANEDSFQSWPEDVQDAVMRAGERTTQLVGQMQDVVELWLADRAEGLEPYTIDETEVERMNETFADTQDNWADETENGREALDEYTDHLDSYRSEYEDRLENGRVSYLLEEDFGNMYEEYGVSDEHPEFVAENVQ